MVIAAYYRPPNSTDETYLTETYNEQMKYIIILSGDFNLPDICWKSNTITKHQYPQRVNQLFLDLSHNLGLEQIVDFPTRQDNTLDLVFTSHPAFKLRCKSLPPSGKKGNHDIVLDDCSHKVVRSKTPRRKNIPLEKGPRRKPQIKCKTIWHWFYIHALWVNWAYVDWL